MIQFEDESMEMTLLKVGGDITEVIKGTNSQATSLYNTLYSVTDKVQTIKKKVAVLGDMITDLSIINGRTKTNVELAELDIVSQKGVVIDKEGVIGLGKIREQLVEYSIKTSGILSNKPIVITDMTGRSRTVEDLFKYKTRTKVSVSNIGYNLNVNLKYSKVSKVNQIVIELPSDTTSYPLLSDIKITAPNGLSLIPIKILENNSYNFSLDENRMIGNVYKIDIEPVDTRELQFSLSSKTESFVELVSITTNYATHELNGEIILGPLVSDTPILKVGVSSTESSDNVLIQVSTDQEQWTDLVDSYRLSVDSVRKIVAFNTINESSFKTDTEITSLYIKLIFSAKPVESIATSLAYDSYREDGVISDNTLSLTEDNRVSAFRVKSDDFSYGLNTYITGTEITKGLRDTIDNIRVNGNLKVAGFNDTDYSLGYNTSNQSNVNVELKHLRLPATTDIDASSFDSVGSELYDINLIPIEGDINIKSSEDICAKLSNKEDDYRLISSITRKFIDYKVTSNFIRSASNALIQVPKEDIELVDSLGVVLRVFKEEDLLKIEEDEETIYFVSLIGILYRLPEVTNYMPNLLYPFKALAENEYSLEDGKIILGKGTIINIIGNKIVKTKVSKKLDISYQNGNTWERLDRLYTYHNTQIDTRPKETTVIKLDHRSIERGSLTIYEYNSYDTVGTEDSVFINVANNYLNNSQYLTEEQGTNVYIEE